MKSAACSVLIVALAAALLGCGEDALDSADAGKMRLYDPQEQKQMKAALSNARIPFEVHSMDGNEEIWYDSRFQERVLRVRDQVFGVPPPIGRNIVLDSESIALFAEEMRRRGAAYHTGAYHGSQYVAWETESDEAADAALEVACVSSEMLMEMRRQRKLADSEKSDRANSSSRSREERLQVER